MVNISVLLFLVLFPWKGIYVYDTHFWSSLLVNKDNEIISYIRFCNLPLISTYLKKLSE